MAAPSLPTSGALHTKRAECEDQHYNGVIKSLSVPLAQHPFLSRSSPVGCHPVLTSCPRASLGLSDQPVTTVLRRAQSVPSSRHILTTLRTTSPHTLCSRSSVRLVRSSLHVLSHQLFEWPPSPPVSLSSRPRTGCLQVGLCRLHRAESGAQSPSLLCRRRRVLTAGC